MDLVILKQAIGMTHMKKHSTNHACTERFSGDIVLKLGEILRVNFLVLG